MSSIESLQTAINELEASLPKIIEQLDAATNQFAIEVVPVAANWMNVEVKRRIEENAEIVNAKGGDYIRRLKSDFTGLVERLPEIAKQAIGRPEDWPHRTPRQTARASKEEPFFAATFRRIINHLGMVLHNHGIIQPTKEREIPAWEKQSNGTFKYAINPLMEDQAIPSLKQFAQLQARREAQEANLHDLQAQLARAKASQLWDQG